MKKKLTTSVTVKNRQATLMDLRACMDVRKYAMNAFDVI